MTEIKPFSEDITTGAEFYKERKSEQQVLKENRIPLTREERNIVMARKAVWHQGLHGEETPAVWKSKNSRGEIRYATNTHRAIAICKSLLEAVGRFHKFIKGTA